MSGNGNIVKNATAGIVGVAGALVLLAGAGMMLSKLEDGEGPSEQTRRGSEYLITIESVYGDVEYGPDLDVNGDLVKTLYPEDREVFHQLWVNGEEVPVSPDDNLTDRVGTWQYELLVPVGTSIRYHATQQHDGLLMCSVRQDTLTMDLKMVESPGQVCEVEYLVMGQVWP